MLRVKSHLAIHVILFLLAIFSEAIPQDRSAPAYDEQRQATRDPQDPTTAINGLFFSTEPGFGAANNDTTLNLQAQRIATVALKEWENTILRDVIPVSSAPTPTDPGDGLQTAFDLSNAIIQALHIPSNQHGPVKCALGSQISFEAYTDEMAQAAGWGGVVTASAFGIAWQLSFGAVANHFRSEADFSTQTVQPIVFYNLTSPGIGDWFFEYKNSTTDDRSGDGGNQWTVPVGGAFGETSASPSEQVLPF